MSDRREINRIRLDGTPTERACVADTPNGPLVFGGRGDGGPWIWDPRGTDWQARDLVHEGFDRHLVDYLSEWDLLYDCVFVWHDGRPLLFAGSRYDDPYEHVHEDGDDCVDWEDEELEMPVGASVRLYDLGTGRRLHGPPPLHEWHMWGITALSTPDGLFGLSGGGDGCTRAVAWDLDAGTAIGEPLAGHRDGVSGVALALVGGRVVGVTGSHDGTVRAWDVRENSAIGPEWTLPSQVRAVAVSHVDGRPIVLAGGDFAGVHLRDLESGEVHARSLNTAETQILLTVEHDGRVVLVHDGKDDVISFLHTDGTRAAAPIGGGLRLLGAGTAGGRVMVATTGGENLVQVWDPFA